MKNFMNSGIFVSVKSWESIFFINAESETETKRIISESLYYGGSGIPSENYRIYSPRRDYVKSERLPLSTETNALRYKYPNINKVKNGAYLEFLQEHITFFTKKGSMNITTINSPEMEKGNPLFSKLYITHRFQQGYLIYNELLKPIISMHRKREI